MSSQSHTTEFKEAIWRWPQYLLAVIFMKGVAGDRWRRWCQRLCKYSVGRRPYLGRAYGLQHLELKPRILSALLLKPKYSSVGCFKLGIMYWTM